MNQYEDSAGTEVRVTESKEFKELSGKAKINFIADLGLVLESSEWHERL